MPNEGQDLVKMQLNSVYDNKLNEVNEQKFAQTLQN